jgi:hypothetical protein
MEIKYFHKDNIVTNVNYNNLLNQNNPISTVM